VPGASHAPDDADEVDEVDGVDEAPAVSATSELSEADEVDEADAVDEAAAVSATSELFEADDTANPCTAKALSLFSPSADESSAAETFSCISLSVASFVGLIFFSTFKLPHKNAGPGVN
jgi:hypothetical protein